MSNKKTLFETGRDFLEQFKMTTGQVAEILEGLHSAITEHEAASADKPLTQEYLAQMGFKHVTQPTFEGVSAYFYYKDSIVAFISNVNENHIQVGVHDIINGKHHAITLRHISTERQLHQVYEAVMGKPLVASNERIEGIHQHKAKATVADFRHEHLAVMSQTLGVPLSDIDEYGLPDDFTFPKNSLIAAKDTNEYHLMWELHWMGLTTLDILAVKYLWRVTEPGVLFFRNNYKKYLQETPRATLAVSQEMFDLMAHTLGHNLYDNKHPDVLRNDYLINDGNHFIPMYLLPLQKLGYMTQVSITADNFTRWEVTKAGIQFFRDNYKKYIKQ